MASLDILATCFREALALPADAAVEGLAYQEHPAWDSVAHMRLVAALESAFDIMMETDEILELSSFDTAKEILARYDIRFDA